MPSVASDPNVILPPPVRSNASSRSATYGGDDSSPFADMVDQSVQADRPTPADRASSRAASSDNSNSADKPRQADSADRPDKPDQSDKSAKSSDDKSSPDKKADKTLDSKDATTSADTTTSTADASTAEIDQAAQLFAAAVAGAKQAQNADPKADGDSKADGENKDDKVAVDATKSDAAPADPTAAKAAPEIKTADAAAIATTVTPQADVAVAPKTSVPQVPRVAAPAAAKQAAKAQTQADTKATTAEDGSDDAKASKAAGDANADGAELAPVVRRAERFSATLEAETNKQQPKADTTAPKADASQIVLPQALTQQQQTTAAAPAAPQTTATTDASKPVPLDGVAVTIAAKASEGSNRFEIRLDPPELGRIEVRLDVDKSGQVVSHITADRGDTLDLLRRDSSNLERALQDAGLKTGDSAMQFSLRDQGFTDDNQSGGKSNTAQMVVSDETTPALTPSNYRAFGARTSGVDIRV